MMGYMEENNVPVYLSFDHVTISTSYVCMKDIGGKWVNTTKKKNDKHTKIDRYLRRRRRDQ